MGETSMNDCCEDDRFLSLLAVDQYRREVRRVEMVTSEELERLLARVERGMGERSKVCPNQWVLSLAHLARNRLVEAYQPCVLGLASRFLPLCWSLELGDLVSEGSLYLMQRLEEFFRSPIQDFTAFVSSVVYKGLVTALRRLDGMVRLPDEMHQLLGRKKRFERDFQGVHHRLPSLVEMAQGLEVKVSLIVDALHGSHLRSMKSLESLLFEDETVDRRGWVDLFEVSQVLDDAAQRGLSADLQCALEKMLTSRQREVVWLKYRFDDGGSVPRYNREVAQLLGVTQDDVSYHDVHALKRLRQALELISKEGRVCCVLREGRPMDYYNLSQAACVLGMSSSTFQRRYAAGVIACSARKVGRQVLFEKQEFDAFVARYRLGCVS